jgi:predicted glycosyltransferase
MRKILVYSHDTFGLGNIRRMMEIAKHLVGEDPDVSVLILTGSPMLHAFRIPSRIDYLKLPCLARTREGDYTVKYLSLHYQDTVRLRANLILSTVLDFQPDLILVDKKPLGVGNELMPTLEMLGRRTTRPKLVLLLRDILDSPEATVAVWRKNGYFEAIESWYDRVLVVGSPEIFDVRNEYEFPRACADKVEYCGYIGRERSKRSRAATREQLGIGDEKLVVVSAGGGGDGFDLLSCYLDSLAGLPASRRFRSLLVCGPEMSESQHAHLRRSARRYPDVELKEFSDDMMGLLDAADVAVCMGGYNTVCEVLTLRKPAVVVPRVKPVEEQWIRAHRMAKLGLLDAIHPDELTPKRLLRAVLDALGRENVVSRNISQIDLSGLKRVGASLDRLLGVRPAGYAMGLQLREAAL